MVRKATLWLLAVGALLLAPATASAATPHLTLVSAGILGSIFGAIGHAVLGAFSWTIGLASKFVLTTIAALVKLLIPHAWINKGLQIMEWIVAVPDYAGKITAPGGGQQYGFQGINALRDLFMWLGVAVVPLSLTYATGRAMIGEYEPVGIPVLRVLAIAVVIVSYPYWWSQAAALTDQVTHAILTLPDVAAGLQKLMVYAVDGVALGGWQLIDLGLMGAIGLELLGLIFLKVVLILLGALLYATGPLMLGLVPTRAGGAVARAWASAVTMLFALGIGWATLFAVGALLINDAGTAGPLIAGDSTFGTLVGGLLLAVAGLASLWLCLKAAKEAGALMRLQFAGLLTLGHSRGGGGSSATVSTRGRTTGRSLGDYGSRLARASSAAGGELVTALPGGTALASAGRTAGYVGRRGLVGTAAVGASLGAKLAAGPTAALVGRSRAGAVAVRMAHAGTASWTGTQRRGAHSATDRNQDGTPRKGASARAPGSARASNPRKSESPRADGRSSVGRAAGKAQTATGSGRTAPETSDRSRRPRGPVTSTSDGPATVRPVTPPTTSTRAAAKPQSGAGSERPAPATPDRSGRASRPSGSGTPGEGTTARPSTPRSSPGPAPGTSPHAPSRRRSQQPPTSKPSVGTPPAAEATKPSIRPARPWRKGKR